MEKALIAWLVGTEPRKIAAREGWDPKVGSGLTFADPSNMDGYELLRVEGNVEVYRDKETGKEVYTGHTSAPVESMFKVASGIIRANRRFIGQSPVEGQNAEQVANAVEMLDKVIAKVTSDWRVYWLQGKGYVALGNLPSAYASFQHAFDLEKQEEVIPREFAGVCLELGKFDQAVELAERGVALQPDSHELLGNLAVSHLLAGHIEAAQKTIAAAMKIKATDLTNCIIGTVIAEVAAGKRPVPKSTAELQATLRPMPISKPKPFWQFWKK